MCLSGQGPWKCISWHASVAGWRLLISTLPGWAGQCALYFGLWLPGRDEREQAGSYVACSCLPDALDLVPRYLWTTQRSAASPLAKPRGALCLGISARISRSSGCQPAVRRQWAPAGSTGDRIPVNQRGKNLLLATALLTPHLAFVPLNCIPARHAWQRKKKKTFAADGSCFPFSLLLPKTSLPFIPHILQPREADLSGTIFLRA